MSFAMSRLAHIMIGLNACREVYGGMHDNVLNANEIEICHHNIGKGPNLLAGDGFVHIVTGCAASSKAGATVGLMTNASNRTDELGDSVAGNVCIMKSSKNNGQDWEHFQVLTPNGLHGTNYGSCKAMYDKQHKQIVVQYVYYPNGQSTGAQKPKYCQITSADNGNTWSQPRDFTAELAPCMAGGTHVAGMAGNRIQLDNRGRGCLRIQKGALKIRHQNRVFTEAPFPRITVGQRPAAVGWQHPPWEYVRLVFR